MASTGPLVQEMRKLSRLEYDRVVGTGLFDDESVELLEGVIVQMPPPHGPEHDGTIHVLAKLLTTALGSAAEVRIQSSFAADERSEPEPDLAVVPLGDYRDAHPTVAWLIVEVADSSILRDRTTKADVYAAAGVPEYWVVDLVHRTVEVRTEPSAAAGYAALATKRRGDVLVPAKLPDVRIAVSNFLR